MSRTINTGAGDVEQVSTVYTGTAELTGVSPLLVAFGTYAGPPGAWQTPDTTTLSADKKSVTLTVTVGAGHYNPVAGNYWLWRKVGGDVSVDSSTRYVINTDTGYPVGTATALLTIGEVA